MGLGYLGLGWVGLGLLAGPMRSVWANFYLQLGLSGVHNAQFGLVGWASYRFGLWGTFHRFVRHWMPTSLHFAVLERRLPGRRPYQDQRKREADDDDPSTDRQARATPGPATTHPTSRCRAAAQLHTSPHASRHVVTSRARRRLILSRLSLSLSPYAEQLPTPFFELRR